MSEAERIKTYLDVRKMKTINMSVQEEDEKSTLSMYIKLHYRNTDL